jgi:hypothetical protein
LFGTSRKMTLNRIPPILVAGDGAAEYFKSLGGKLLPNDALIEPNALTRWKSWRKELDVAERRRKRSWKLANRSHKDLDGPLEPEDSSPTSLEEIEWVPVEGWAMELEG